MPAPQIKDRFPIDDRRNRRPNLDPILKAIRKNLPHAFEPRLAGTFDLQLPYRHLLVVRHPHITQPKSLPNPAWFERADLTMQKHMRRFTRLTNACSKKFENHCHMVALYAVWYNFIRIHKTLRVTPAMEAGVTDLLFSFEDWSDRRRMGSQPKKRDTIYALRSSAIRSCYHPTFLSLSHILPQIPTAPSASQV